MTQTLSTLSLMERVLFLRKVPLFARAPAAGPAADRSIAEEQAFADGDVIAEQGDAGDEMHIIVSGEVSVIVGAGDDERVVATRSSGDVVGEMAMVTNEPRMAGLVARGPVRVLSIDRRRFESILRERPETSLGVIRVLCQRLATKAALSAARRRRHRHHEHVDLMALEREMPPFERRPWRPWPRPRSPR